MKKVFLFIAMVTVSVVTWAQDNGVYRAIEGEQFKEYIDELTKYLFGNKIVPWDDVIEEDSWGFSFSAHITEETTYYDKRNGLIVKVIRKSSEEVEKDLNSDLKRVLPQSVLYSTLNKENLMEKANDKCGEMRKFNYRKTDEIPYNFVLYGFVKSGDVFNMICGDF